jgi:hypothetical protein
MLATGTLAACGSAAPREDMPRPWLEHAGEPVESVRYATLVDWQPLGRDTVMIRFEGGRFYSVRLKQPCIGHVREADRLGIDTAFDRQLRENDSIRLDASSCLVDEIRPLDWRAYADARAQR